MTTRVFAAVDIGASSGRVMAGIVDGEDVTLETMHRFANGAVETGGALRWDLTRLFRETLTGLALLAAQYPQVESIGIDTWAVDYALLDASGNLLAEPIAYRDQRTAAVIDDVHAMVAADELFAINGLQFLPFTTIYQLVAEQRGPRWDRARHVVLLPDLLAYWLTGELRTETTNASTTGLFDVCRQSWSTDLLNRIEVPPALLSPLIDPGAVLGPVLPDVADEYGLDPSTVVTTVGSHDTASAVVGIPATTERFAFVVSGTWSLVGVEIDKPILTDAAMHAKFTNEGGVDGRTRFLRNVGGLWLLQECQRTWSAEGHDHDLSALVTDAAARPPGGPLLDVDDPAFIPPDDMPTRIALAVGQAALSPAETVRCIVDSLAAAYARTVQQAVELSGEGVDVIHIVGGGSQNELLCQLTADLAHLPVLAGPVEATAFGNVMVQARAHGAAPPSLEAVRKQIAASTPPRRYDPS